MKNQITDSDKEYNRLLRILNKEMKVATANSDIDTITYLKIKIHELKVKYQKLPISTAN